VKRETTDEKRRRALELARRLARAYPGLQVPLQHKNTFELLVAVILSAQTTDEMVNHVTPELFRRYPTPEALSRAPIKSLEALIRRLGLFHAKALALKKMSRHPRTSLRRSRRHRRHALQARLPPPRPHARGRAGKNRARSDEIITAGGVDGFFPPAGAPRAKSLLRAEAGL
jgi:hypothetical protein